MMKSAMPEIIELLLSGPDRENAALIVSKEKGEPDGIKKTFM
jgi:hypothetical protein